LEPSLCAAGKRGRTDSRHNHFFVSLHIAQQHV
jgi:hypothetical protein